MNKYTTFKQLLEDYEQPGKVLPDGYFKVPKFEPFDWLRVEWIPSPDWLYKLFAPERSRFETIRRFGNTWISGPRGCGKSHYLRVLAFHPEVVHKAESDPQLASILNRLDYDFTKSFGVLFTCRMGEFKMFTPEAQPQSRFDLETQRFLKHLLILKIWNRTLYALRDGSDCNLIQVPPDVHIFLDFLQERLGKIAVVEDPEPMGVFLQCLRICLINENSATATWHDPVQRQIDYLLDEGDLDKFFTIIKQTFIELKETRFFILVDDASSGNMHLELQKIFNSLVRAAHANHCFKITFDKFMYTSDTSDGRAIDPRHEITYVDLGEVSTKSQKKMLIDLAAYTADVLNCRLKAAGYQYSIQEILGQSQTAADFIQALSRPRSLRGKEKGEKSGGSGSIDHPYYGGWNILWNICHGSIRTLLELVENVFKSNDVTRDTRSIPLKDQDSVVRAYAKRHFKALSMLPGEIDATPVGNKLQDVLSALGEMSRMYLREFDTGDKQRRYETISLERLDRTNLDPKAQHILDELLRYGLLMDEGVTFSRAQVGLSRRYDMNKIFSPAFETTYRVRNHIYLSKGRFEQWLLEPAEFVARHRRKLDELAEKKKARMPVPGTLFDD